MDVYRVSEGNYCSYWGSWSVDDKAVTGVHILILNEHVARVIEVEKDKFKKEIGNIITNFNEATSKLLKKVHIEIDKFDEEKRVKKK